jgi:hypothetical protein
MSVQQLASFQTNGTVPQNASRYESSVSVNMSVFRYVRPCCLVVTYREFGETYLHFSSYMNMQATHSSESG